MLDQSSGGRGRRFESSHSDHSFQSHSRIQVTADQADIWDSAQIHPVSLVETGSSRFQNTIPLKTNDARRRDQRQRAQDQEHTTFTDRRNSK